MSTYAGDFLPGLHKCSRPRSERPACLDEVAMRASIFDVVDRWKRPERSGQKSPLPPPQIVGRWDGNESGNDFRRTRTSRGRGRCKLPRVKFSEALASREHLTPQMRSSPSCASSVFRSPFATPLANDGRGADDDEDNIGVGSVEDA